MFFFCGCCFVCCGVNGRGLSKKLFRGLKLNSKCWFQTFHFLLPLLGKMICSKLIFLKYHHVENVFIIITLEVQKHHLQEQVVLPYYFWSNSLDLVVSLPSGRVHRITQAVAQRSSVPMNYLLLATVHLGLDHEGLVEQVLIWVALQK